MTVSKWKKEPISACFTSSSWHQVHQNISSRWTNLESNSNYPKVHLTNFHNFKDNRHFTHFRWRVSKMSKKSGLSCPKYRATASWSAHKPKDTLSWATTSLTISLETTLSPTPASPANTISPSNVSASHTTSSMSMLRELTRQAKP